MNREDTFRRWALNPEWEKVGRIHDWRNYISPVIRTMWDTFTETQKIEMVRWADELAGREEWD